MVWEASAPAGRIVHGQRYRDASPVGDPFVIGIGDTVPAPGAAPRVGTMPAVAALADGFVVAWASDRQDGAGANVYARRYATNGRPAGDEFRVNRVAANDQWQPSVAALGDGGFVVTWSSNQTDAAITGVYGQRYDAAGARVSKPFRVMAHRKQRSDSAVTALAGNDFVIAYSAGQANLQDVQNIKARRYDPVGALGAALRLNTARNSYQSAPRLASFAESGFVAVWTLEDGSGGSQINARLYTAQGAPLGAVFRLDEAAPDLAGAMASVASLPNGRAVVVWQSRNTATQATRIQAQRINLKGAGVE